MLGIGTYSFKSSGKAKMTSSNFDIKIYISDFISGHVWEKNPWD